MYDRVINEEPLRFAVSGKLWNRSLVMVDENTQSLWSHLLGQCMEGALKDKVLETLPSTLVDWKTWKTRHPKTTVLAMSRTAQDFVKDFQQDAGRFVLGLRNLSVAKAYSFEWLVKTPVINDTFDGDPVLLVYDVDATGGRAFVRKIGDKTLVFELDANNQLQDIETKSMWDSLGKCVSGALKDKQLREIPAIVSFRKAWHAFYPETATYRP